MAYVQAAMAVIGAVASLASGAKQSQALKEQSMQAEFDARNQENLTAVQLSGERRADLNHSLAAIDAIRAGRNVASGSPTEFAIKADLRRRSENAEFAEQAGVREGIFSTRYKGDQARRAAPFALMKGYANAASSAYSIVAAGGGGGGGG